MMETLLLIIIFLFSAIVHEISHGWMALNLGDNTAQRAGRLTLNPVKHLDPIGSVFLPLFLVLTGSHIIFGWAKPVPVNPFNFRDQKYGNAKVALAGPLSNILLAVLFGVILRFLPQSSLFFQNLSMTFAIICWVNLLLAFFNLLPIPPLDGSHILFAVLPSRFNNAKRFLALYGFFILIFFLLFFFQYFVPLINFFFKLITTYSFI